ncbi:MAG: hypothetical protein ACQERZ_02705 [Fusobacteriota bacterium]
MREHSDKRIHIFDRIGDYQNYLKQYRILSEEWENIKQTNSSEGGVDEFFSKSRNSVQLVENLLIKSVEKMMFKDKDRKKELFYAFSEYRNKLLEMPKIKANIKDFSVIKEDAEELVETVKKLGEFVEGLESKKIELTRFGRKVESNIKNIENNIKKLEEQEVKIKTNINDLKWKKESYKIFQKRSKLDKISLEKEKLIKNIENIQNLLKLSLKKKDQLEGIKLYKSLKDEEQEKKKYQQKLDMLDRSNPELKKRLLEKKGELGYTWELREEFLEEEKDEQNSLKEELKKEKLELKEEVDSKKDELEELRTDKASLNAWLAEYSKKVNKFKKDLGISKFENPKKLKKSKSEEYKLLQNKKVDFENQLKEIENKQEETSQEILKISNDKISHNNMKEKIQEKLDDFHNEEDTLLGTLASREILENDILKSKDEILFKTKGNFKDFREKRVILKSEIANLEEKWALFSDREYYIPDSELIIIKKALEDANIYSVLGSEWISNQNLTQGEKKEYLDNQPLLPYSILIEEDQKSKVEKFLKQRGDTKRDFPLIFLVKNTQNLNRISKPDSLKKFKSGAYIFQPKSVDIFTSKEIFSRFKENLSNKIEKLNSELKEVNENENIWGNLLKKLENFYKSYTKNKISQWNENLNKHINLIEKSQKRINDLEKNKKDLKLKLIKKREGIQKINSDISNLERIIEKLDEITEDYINKNKKEDKLKELNRSIKRLTGHINHLSQKREELYDKELKIDQKSRALSLEIKKHREDKNRYNIQDIEIRESEKDYSEIKIEVDEILKQLNKKKGKREDIERIIEKCIQDIEKINLEINKLDIKREWIKENIREISEIEEKELNEKINKYQMNLESEKQYLVKTDAKINRIEGAVESLEEYLEREFKKEGYYKFTENHLEEYEIIKSEFQKSKEKLSDILEKIEKNREQSRENKQTLRMLNKEYPFLKQEYWNKKETTPTDKWDLSKISTENIYFDLTKEYKEIAKKLETQKRKVDKSFNLYLNELNNTNNPNVRQFTRKVKSIMENSRIYDYDFVETQFLRILEGLERYRLNYMRQLEENKKDMEHLTNLCLRRAQVVFEAIKEIPKNSKIDLYGKRIQVIKMDWDLLSEDKERDLIYEYLEKVLNDLQKLKEDGTDDDTIDSKMEERLRTRNLINVIAPLENCRVRVFKPRKESIINEIQLDYADWKEVVRWSGGEEYSVYMTMFMIMVSYIRRQLEGNATGYKTILADNPFGKASSPHILEIVFEVAKSNNIQLLCLTAHRQESIMNNFPVVYSLKLRNAYGKEVMTSEKMEVGFYQKKS